MQWNDYNKIVIEFSFKFEHPNEKSQHELKTVFLNCLD
jgi:hypothetical protein